jgi:hypothetical protein
MGYLLYWTIWNIYFDFFESISSTELNAERYNISQLEIEKRRVDLELRRYDTWLEQSPEVDAWLEQLLIQSARAKLTTNINK